MQNEGLASMLELCLLWPPKVRHVVEVEYIPS